MLGTRVKKDIQPICRIIQGKQPRNCENDQRTPQKNQTDTIKESLANRDNCVDYNFCYESKIDIKGLSGSEHWLSENRTYPGARSPMFLSLW